MRMTERTWHRRAFILWVAWTPAQQSHQLGVFVHALAVFVRAQLQQALAWWRRLLTGHGSGDDSPAPEQNASTRLSLCAPSQLLIAGSLQLASTILFERRWGPKHCVPMHMQMFLSAIQIATLAA
jgi:hypothetical protein